MKILFLIICLGVTQGSYPGINFALRTDIVNQFQHIFVPKIVSEMPYVSIPNMNIENALLTDLRIAELKLPQKKIEVNFDHNLISFNMKNLSFHMVGKIHYPTFFGTIVEDLNVHSTDTGIQFKLHFNYGNEEIYYEIEDFELTLRNLKVDINGFMGKLSGFLFSEFSNEMESYFKSILSPFFEMSISQSLEKIATDVPGIFVSEQFLILANYKPVTQPMINSEFILYGLNGTVYTLENEEVPPFENTVILPSINQTDNNTVQVFISDFVFNSALWSMNQAQSLNYTVTQSDLPQSFPISLNTIGLELFFSEIAIKFGDKPVELSCSSNSNFTPAINFSQDSIAMVIAITCDVNVINTSQNETAVTFTTYLNLSLDGFINQKINALQVRILGADITTISIDNSEVGHISTDILKWKLNLILDSAKALINTGFEKNQFPIPEVHGLTFNNLSFQISDGFLSLSMTPEIHNLFFEEIPKIHIQ